MRPDPVRLREQEARIDELQAELRQVTTDLEQLRTYHHHLRFQVVDRAHWLLSRAWPGLRISRLLRWPLMRLWGLLQRFETAVVLHRWVDRLLFLDPSEYGLCAPGIRRLLWPYVLEEVRERLGFVPFHTADAWLRTYRPDDSVLRTWRTRVWPRHAPTFTVVLRSRGGPPGWLEASVTSVRQQIYPHWELLCAAPPGPALRAAGADARVRFVDALAHAQPAEAARAAVAEALGDFICWLDEGDILEPHALYRFADAVLDSGVDLLYSDEVVSSEDLSHVLSLEVRPQFSYDHYLSRAYFQHLTAVRRSLLQTADTVDLASDDGLVLSALERARGVAHVPDILYRHRPFTRRQPPVGMERVARVQRHLDRLGCVAEVARTDHPECLDVRYRMNRRVRIAIVIPTKNRVDLLQRCIDTLEGTISPGLAAIHVVDHESDEPTSIAYLDTLRVRHPVLRYHGPFNFSRINNYAIHQLGRDFTHYLFLNNDIEARHPGWLDHMASLAQRQDVGVVGAVLLYPDGTVQHAGATIGFYFGADHSQAHTPAFGADGRRVGGRDMGLLATREVSAVTGACLLISAEVFHAIGGFDVNLAVGFGDTDLCLRVRARGLKVLLDPQAVLLHHGSATRGTQRGDPHPADTQFLRARYLQAILAGDPFSSPFVSRRSPEHLNPSARCRAYVSPRVAPVVRPALPEPKDGAPSRTAEASPGALLPALDDSR